MGRINPHTVHPLIQPVSNPFPQKLIRLRIHLIQSGKVIQIAVQRILGIPESRSAIMKKHTLHISRVRCYQPARTVYCTILHVIRPQLQCRGGMIGRKINNYLQSMLMRSAQQGSECVH
ncbi:hypothetical protein D3C73_632560 [compost metagenome]